MTSDASPPSSTDVAVDASEPLGQDVIVDASEPVSQDVATDTSTQAEDVIASVDDIQVSDTTTPTDTTEPPDTTSESDAPQTTDAPPTEPSLCGAVDDHPEWELCKSGPEVCEVLFEDSAGCAAVCEALGLTCHATWENVDDSCAPDTTRPPLTCEPESGHQSDYCVCRTPDSTCVPDCEGKACGDDGCGGPCGACDAGVPCVDNQCACVPKTCASMLYQCGGNYDDGCGGTFSCPGQCPPEMPCQGGFCGGAPAPCAAGDCPAFPGAEGEGMYAVGGRGGGRGAADDAARGEGPRV